MKTQTNLAALLLVAGGLALNSAPAAAGGNPCSASASPKAGVTRAAQKTLNPCAAKAANPCAANPCAANPCAAKANPCAAKAANPCAANPCAANPCAANPCAAKKTQKRPN